FAIFPFTLSAQVVGQAVPASVCQKPNCGSQDYVMLVVQKYGGTSVGSVERIKGVAKRVAATRAAGHQVAVVVSAMSGETNRLLALAKEVAARPDERESDVL